jgi:hypothetical protein
MQWLFEKKCPWGSLTFEHATAHGNLENMKWLLENGCPWNHHTFERKTWQFGKLAVAFGKQVSLEF